MLFSSEAKTLSDGEVKVRLLRKQLFVFSHCRKAVPDDESGFLVGHYQIVPSKGIRSEPVCVFSSVLNEKVNLVLGDAIKRRSLLIFLCL